MPYLRSVCNKYQYDNETAIERVIGSLIYPSEDKCIYYGSCDMFLDIDSMVAQIKAIQSTCRNYSTIGKKIIHTILSFTDEEQQLILEHFDTFHRFCMACSQFYHCIGHVNMFSVMLVDGRYELHFAINSVNHYDGRKLMYTNPNCLMHQNEFNMYFNIIFNSIQEKET